MGMFIKEATDKLKDVATALFKSRENDQRAQPLQGQKQTEVTKAEGEVKAAPAAVTPGVPGAPVVPGAPAVPTPAAPHQYDPGA
jgi:hypothetical protein